MPRKIFDVVVLNKQQTYSPKKCPVELVPPDCLQMFDRMNLLNTAEYSLPLGIYNAHQQSKDSEKSCNKESLSTLPEMNLLIITHILGNPSSDLCYYFYTPTARRPKGLFRICPPFWPSPLVLCLQGSPAALRLLPQHPTQGCLIP